MLYVIYSQWHAKGCATLRFRIIYLQMYLTKLMFFYLIIFGVGCVFFPRQEVSCVCSKEHGRLVTCNKLVLTT